MADSYLPLSLTVLRVGRELPLDVWNSHGVLLLSKGQPIATNEQLRTLAGHRPMVRQQDFDRLTPRMQALLLQSGAAKNGAQLGSANSVKAVPLLQLDPAQAWPDLHIKLTTLLNQHSEVTGFAERIDEIASLARTLTRSRPDDSLFVMLQQLQHSAMSYNATHALLCCILCQLVGEQLALNEAEHASLCKAALTMNIGMSRLQDQLSQQKSPPDQFQRKEIDEHPVKGHIILQKLGIQDTTWLGLVADHHETPDGKGYPTGKTDLPIIQHLLRMADIFAARISPRVTRAALSPLLAVRNTYLEYSNSFKQLGDAFVKALGLYPPGSYVKLNTNEVAVVMRRGRKANEPVTLAITNNQGAPIAIPPLRDTAHLSLEVSACLSADQIKVRLDPGRLLKRVHIG